MPTQSHLCDNASIRSRWLGIVVIPSRMRQQLIRAISELNCNLDRPWKWLLIATIVGAVPVVMDHLSGYHISRWLTPILILPLLLGSVVRDSCLYAFMVLGGMLVAHCLTMIGLSTLAPEHWAEIFPPGYQYWEVTKQWVVTGKSQEYQLDYWVPGHIQLALAMVFYTYCSLGLITLWHGLHEVDLMNLYVTQMWLHSDGSFGVVAFAWHPWSVCRGVGFVLVTYELVSLSFQHLTRTRLSNRQARLKRWGLGIGFLLLDMLMKYMLLESVRQVLERAIQ